MTYFTDTPEKQAAREQFRQQAQAKVAAFKNTVKLLSANTKPAEPEKPARILFKGAGK